MKRALVFMMALVGTSSLVADDKPAVKNLKAAFEKADAILIYSLDPSFDNKEPDAKKGFHGWKILGMTTIKDGKTRTKIVNALAKGFEESDGAAARCFNPRHGLRTMVDGKPVDLVICFECLQIQFRNGDMAKTETTTRTPEKVLDEVLSSNGIPLAPKKKP